MNKKPVTATISLTGLPEVIYGIRCEVATIIMEVAEAEADPRVAERLRKIASEFAAGART